MNFADFTTATDGFPLESDATLGFMQSAYVGAINGLAQMKGGDMTIVSGMAESGNSVGSGWIFINGELVEFVGGTKAATFIVVDTWVQKANLGGSLYNRYRTRRAQFGTGSPQYNYADLQRAEAITTLRERLLDMVAWENEVVVKGCAVSGVSGSTLNIAAGVAVIDRKILSVGSYSGNFPVYLKNDGTYTTTQPSSGGFIKFSPHTSQRLADVVRRATTPLGNVSMQASLPADRFDGTGLGLFEWKGFALANGQNGTVSMKGRFPVGQYADGNSSDPIWDTNYEDIGHVGGEKEVQLTIGQMPSHNHTGGATGGGPVQTGEYGLVRRSNTGEDVTTPGDDTSGSGTEPDVLATPINLPYQGGNQKHENRPPYLVLAFVQRIS